ncbi:MAG: lysophospholipase [Clostridia bacterium]|nr:lysophospholipase [Clostridia bacterium]
MPKFSEFRFPSSNGQNEIFVRLCEPDGTPRGIVQVAHGVAEHSERYIPFLTFLAEHGFVAAADDHLGHGKSARDESELGYFAERDGWDCVVSDLHTLHEKLVKDYPGIPVFLFGHSMGSFLTRTYLIKYPNDLTGAMICGTGQQASIMVAGGKMLSSIVSAFKGKKCRSNFLNGLAFGSYNKEFEPKRTICDWLSRDEKVVDAYMADPFCGFTATAGLFHDMMGGISFISKPKNLANMNKDLPVFFVSGAKDPVGENGKGVEKAVNAFKAAGMKDVTLKLYPDCRHELLNELNKEEVMKDLLDWIESKLK